MDHDAETVPATPSDAVAPAAPAPAAPSATHNSNAPVPPGLSCIFCRYDLGGLERSANCPECGKPVLRSAEPDWLRGLTRQDVERRRDACTFAWAVPWSAAGLIAALLLLSFLRSAVQAGIAGPGCIAIVSILAGVLSVINWHTMLHWPEDSGFRAGPWLGASVGAGAGLVGAILLASAGGGLSAISQTSGGAGDAVAGFSTLGALLLAPLHILLAMLGLRRLLRFMDRPNLASAAGWMAVCAVGPLLCFFGAIGFLIAALSGLGAGPTRTDQLIMTVSGLLFWIGLVPSGILLFAGAALMTKVKRIFTDALAGMPGDGLAA